MPRHMNRILLIWKGRWPAKPRQIENRLSTWGVENAQF